MKTKTGTNQGLRRNNVGQVLNNTGEKNQTWWNYLQGKPILPRDSQVEDAVTIVNLFHRRLKEAILELERNNIHLKEIGDPLRQSRDFSGYH